MPFRAAFATGLEAIYAQFGDSAVWAGVADPVSVIREEAEVESAFGQSRARVSTVLLNVRFAEVAAPAAGDLVTVTPADGGDAIAYQLLANADPRLDPLGLEWTCEAERV